jgi:hypothetical protein
MAICRYSKRQKAPGQKAEGLITGTWSFGPLKKVVTFMATAIAKGKRQQVYYWLCGCKSRYICPNLYGDSYNTQNLLEIFASI